MASHVVGWLVLKDMLLELAQVLLAESIRMVGNVASDLDTLVSLVIVLLICLDLGTHKLFGQGDLVELELVNLGGGTAQQHGSCEQ
jgi:hypothetical protein